MCSSPNIPAPPPPPQDVKQPDTIAQRRRSRTVGMGGPTLLTGPSGATPTGANLGANTLLGG